MQLIKLQTINEKYLTFHKWMDIRTAKGQKRTSGKVQVAKNGILRSCCKEVQQYWKGNDSKVHVRQ